MRFLNLENFLPESCGSSSSLEGCFKLKGITKEHCSLHWPQTWSCPLEPSLLIVLADHGLRQGNTFTLLTSLMLSLLEIIYWVPIMCCGQNGSTHVYYLPNSQKSHRAQEAETKSWMLGPRKSSGRWGGQELSHTELRRAYEEPAVIL